MIIRSLLLGCLLSACPGCASLPQTADQSSAALRADEDAPAIEVGVFTEWQDVAKGLIVEAPVTLSVSKNPDGNLEFSIVNALDEEVFVQATHYGPLGGTIVNASGEVWGTLSVGFISEYVYLYRRLNRPVHRDGKRIACGCCRLRVATSIRKPMGGWLVGSTLVLDVYIHGYYRRTGQRFLARAELPVKIVE